MHNLEESIVSVLFIASGSYQVCNNTAIDITLILRLKKLIQHRKDYEPNHSTGHKRPGCRMHLEKEVYPEYYPTSF